MNTSDIKLLRELVKSVGLSGYNEKSASIFFREANKVNAEYGIDSLGSVSAKIKASPNRINHYQTKNIMLCSHQDVIGYMVKDFNKDGTIEIISGSEIIANGEQGIIETKSGNIDALLYSSDDEEKDGKPRAEIIDTDTNYIDKINIGDLVYFTPYLDEKPRGKLTGTFLDNKSGNFVLIKTMQELVRKECYLHHNFFFVLPTYEETTGFGSKAASEKIRPMLAINVDVFPYDDRKNIGKGPVITLGFNFNKKLNEFAIKVAKDIKIPYQLGVYPGWAECDADHIIPTNGGTPCIDISIPTTNLHSPREVISKADIDRTIKLLVNIIKRIDEVSSLVMEV